MPCWDKVSMTIHDMGICDEEVYTIAEFAKATGVSEQTLNRMDRNGKLVCKRHSHNGRTYRYYTQMMLDEFLQSDIYLSQPMVKNRDLIGRTFGKLHVVDFSEAAVSKGYYGSYHCECECGNEVDLARSELLSGKHLSCGCRYTDLTGQTFGYWYVDGIAEPLITPGGTKVMRYHCTCRCGTKRVIIARSLTSGRSMSCGCFRDEMAISKYELCVCRYLEERGFTVGLGDNKPVGYVQHKSYDDLRGVGGNRLSYDFHVRSDSGEWLIECQGGQHYFPVDLWGGQEAFERQLEHDARKREYAKRIGIPLIEIPHTVFTYEGISDILDTFDISISS